MQPSIYEQLFLGLLVEILDIIFVFLDEDFSLFSVAK